MWNLWDAMALAIAVAPKTLNITKTLNVNLLKKLVDAQGYNNVVELSDIQINLSTFDF